jgi:hypothetical protein
MQQMAVLMTTLLSLAVGGSVPSRMEVKLANKTPKSPGLESTNHTQFPLRPHLSPRTTIR